MKHLLAELAENIRMALGAVATHKLRSALTLLGVLVGVFSIILVMTAMRAMRNNIEKELGQLGSRTFVVMRFPAAYFGGPEGFMKFLRRKEITYAQAMAFKKKADFAPYIGLQTTVWNGDLTSRYDKTPPNISIEGVTPGIFQNQNWSVTEGRALLDSDIESARDVCVISVEVARTLFPRGSAVGERVKVASIGYTVVGVFERPGSSEGAKGIAAIPLTTGLNRYGRRRDVAILVQAQDAASFGDTMEQARGLLRAIRKVAPGDEDDFEITSSDSLIKQFENVTFAVRTGLALVSSIALLAAGVGIMNIMLVSVTERTREIGIRMSIGARRRDILGQFLMEAIVLSLLGGFIGVLLGVGGSNLISSLAGWPTFISTNSIFLAVIFSMAIGVAFGYYPARKASSLNPIEALRYE